MPSTSACVQATGHRAMGPPARPSRLSWPRSLSEPTTSLWRAWSTWPERRSWSSRPCH